MKLIELLDKHGDYISINSNMVETVSRDTDDPQLTVINFNAGWSLLVKKDYRDVVNLIESY